MATRRTQEERRAETQAAILESAKKHFGSRGYAATSLEEIAQDCGISIAPIYHYFKNKENLFIEVNSRLEKAILENGGADHSQVDSILHSWERFLGLCQDPHFRQIVLIDAPSVLGKERTYSSEVSVTALERMRARFHAGDVANYKAEILGRMLMGALAEAGLFVGNCDNPKQASQDALEIVRDLVNNLSNK